ncbi:unnamed protein product [Cylindrotheca closterium]|uniref:Uncharacterized protein n=1 Tax=Cylindrotheca closterium TaxID=2856 RepID=A0AAD2FL99_9STRA|nr:unnamed protein product [Cylindrotheca closterium]
MIRQNATVFFLLAIFASGEAGFFHKAELRNDSSESMLRRELDQLDGDGGGLDGNGSDLQNGFGNLGGFDGDGTAGFGDFGGGLDDPSSSGGNPFGGMDQGDDFLSAMGGFGTEMMTMMFGQCLKNIDLEKLSADPFADVNVGCNAQQATTFNNALTSFETCAGFDLRALIENFASMYVGLLLNCGSYAVTVSNELDGIGMGTEDMEQLKAKESPLPRVPQGCVEALVGNNPFGQAFLYAEEFPGREQKCFSELAGKLPMCTLDEWPIPIVGSWLSSFSCIYGSAQDILMPMLQDSISEELDMLNKCLPQKITATNCKEIRNKCIFDYDDPSLVMAIPPPFWNPPMAQKCKETAVDSGMDDLVDRYEAFRQTCIPAEDLLIWDIAASHQEKHVGKEGGGASYMEAAVATPNASSSVAPNSEPTSAIFVKGLFAGMLVAVVGMFGFSKLRRGSQRPVGDDFNSLELAETSEFT